jgi:hypothetical protein
MKENCAMGWMLSNRLRQAAAPGSPDGQILVFWCPGCDGAHAIHVEKPNHLGARWAWNQDPVRPTFTPSINCWPNSDAHRCHSFVTDGRIQFLSDCGHAMKGQTVELPDWPLSKD